MGNPLHTRLCDMFGIEFPVLAFTHCKDVAAAVTNAGGLGVTLAGLLAAGLPGHDGAHAMFTWMNKQTVKSNAGFIVRFTGRFTCEYQEGPNRIEIAVEDGYADGRPCIIVSPDAFAHWRPPGFAHETPADEQARLMKNLADAFSFQGLQLVVE